MRAACRRFLVGTEISLSPRELGVLNQEFRAPSAIKHFTVTFRYKASSDFKPATGFPITTYIAGTRPDNLAAVTARPDTTGNWKVFSSRYNLMPAKMPTIVRIAVYPGEGKVFLDDIQVTGEAAPNP